MNGVSHQYPKYAGGVLYADDVKFLDTVLEKGVWHADTTTQKDTTKHTAIEYDIAQRPPQVTVQPNPSSGEVTFGFKATNNGVHALYIYDVTGRLEATPVRQTMQQGSEIQTQWSCTTCNSGIYTYILQSPAGVQHGRVVLVK